MKGEGDPPEAPVFFPQPPDEQNLRHHVLKFIEQRTFIFLFPPVQLFQVGAAIGHLGAGFMLDRIDFPADVDGKGDLPVNSVTGCKNEHSNAKIR
jgi:hypothetical protein